MEQQTAGLRESSVIRKVVVFFRSFFCPPHTHTHVDIPTGLVPVGEGTAGMNSGGTRRQ